MIRFIVLIVAMLGTFCPTLAQNEEYYKRDTLREDGRQSTILIPDGTEQKAPPVPRNPKGREEPLPILDRLRLGGSFGLSLGTVTNVNLSPMVGLNLTDRLVGGVGVTYMWFKSRLFSINRSYYGGRTFLMYRILPMINLQAEYEAMNVMDSNRASGERNRTWIGSTLVGGTYTQPLGGRFTRGVHMTALYNLSYGNQIGVLSGRNISPYNSPFVFRITFL